MSLRFSVSLRCSGEQIYKRGKFGERSGHTTVVPDESMVEVRKPKELLKLLMEQRFGPLCHSLPVRVLGLVSHFLVYFEGSFLVFHVLLYDSCLCSFPVSFYCLTHPDYNCSSMCALLPCPVVCIYSHVKLSVFASSSCCFVYLHSSLVN